jgi:hypothetical protein
MVSGPTPRHAGGASPAATKEAQLGIVGWIVLGIALGAIARLAGSVHPAHGRLAASVAGGTRSSELRDRELRQAGR